MFTYMTRFGLWRTALDLHPEDLRTCITSAKQVLEHYLSYEGESFDITGAANEFITAVGVWHECEHALANYGAVLCSREWELNNHRLSPEALFFAGAQKEIRKEGWPYTRPAWATDVAVLTRHRQKLVNLRPDWYGPKFEMEKTE